MIERSEAGTLARIPVQFPLKTKKTNYLLLEMSTNEFSKLKGYLQWVLRIILCNFNERTELFHIFIIMHRFPFCKVNIKVDKAPM